MSTKPARAAPTAIGTMLLVLAFMSALHSSPVQTKSKENQKAQAEDMAKGQHNTRKWSTRQVNDQKTSDAFSVNTFIHWDLAKMLHMLKFAKPVPEHLTDNRSKTIVYSLISGPQTFSDFFYIMKVCEETVLGNWYAVHLLSENVFGLKILGV